jgi:hypothetical protein
MKLQHKFKIMTNHIKNRIEAILHNGGIVIVSLRKLVDVLEDIRSVESINREFEEAFQDIENRKGTIMQSTKEEIFRYINCKEKYKFENQYNGQLR